LFTISRLQDDNYFLTDATIEPEFLEMKLIECAPQTEKASWQDPIQTLCWLPSWLVAFRTKV
jgi:hypothetical protein